MYTNLLILISTKSFIESDITELLQHINNLSFFEFDKLMCKIIHPLYSTNTILPALYTKLTKKCTRCNNPVKIYKKDHYSMYYDCVDCNQLYNFTNTDLDDNVIINSFIQFIKTN
jgi:hypothetical protein